MALSLMRLVLPPTNGKQLKMKAKCVNCGQMLKRASADSDYTWVGKTDQKETCYAGATLVNDEWVSEQDHCTEQELG